MDLRNIKIPNFKFGKIKMDSVEEIDEVNIDYEKVQKTVKKRNTPYENTNYKTVKEFFQRSVKLYPNNCVIAEKPDAKTPYKEITYKEFADDVNYLGTAITKLLNQKDKRIIVIGETQYGWYVSYMALLCGAGLAVPVDRELPDNELENVVKRSRATTIIYSQRKADSIKKIKETCTDVKYFVEMKSYFLLQYDLFWLLS